MAAIVRRSIAVAVAVVSLRPRTIHGFPFLSYIDMRLRLGPFGPPQLHYEATRNEKKFGGKQLISVDKWWNRELTLKCKLKCYVKPMKDPLGVSPSKGNQGTRRSKEKNHSYVPLLSLRRDSPPKSSPTYSVRPRSSVGRVTVDLIRRSWVRFPPRSKEFFLYLVWFPDSFY